MPKEELAEIVYKDWSKKFGEGLNIKVVMLSGETGTDLKVSFYILGNVMMLHREFSAMWCT